MKLAVSIGCPSGIGPEVSVVAAAELVESGVEIVLVGDRGALARAARTRSVEGVLERVRIFEPSPKLAARDRVLGTPSRAGGAAQLAWINAACDLVATGHADALVTGPVSKDAIASSGAPGSRGFLGHTEHLQRRLHAREVVMAFASDKLTTALVTTHIPLRDVPRAITPAAVARATYWLGDYLAAGSRIAVAALNPHAGEHGRIGREETRIAAGIRKAAARLGRRSRLVGPVPAETSFRLAARGEYDGVVAMYHDQATIPMKLLGFGDAVNVTLGLPIVRTSVDHGTAYDRAARFDAAASGMVAAMRLASRLAGSA